MKYNYILWIFLLIVPVMYMWYNTINSITVPLLLLITGITILISRKKTAKELGFVKFQYGIKYYSYLLIGLLAGIFLLKLIFQPTTLSLSESHFFGIFIIVSFAQEFLYRSYLYSELKKKGKIKFMIISSILYAFLHTIFNNPVTMFFIAFTASLAFSYVYWKKQNFWLISIVHSIANFFAVWMGFFV